jgi:hypothetical protein
LVRYILSWFPTELVEVLALPPQVDPTGKVVLRGSARKKARDWEAGHPHEGKPSDSSSSGMDISRLSLDGSMSRLARVAALASDEKQYSFLEFAKLHFAIDPVANPTGTLRAKFGGTLTRTGTLRGKATDADFFWKEIVHRVKFSTVRERISISRNQVYLILANHKIAFDKDC